MDAGVVTWNDEYETYEYIEADGYTRIFRDDTEARKFADRHNLKFIEKNER